MKVYVATMIYNVGQSLIVVVYSISGGQAGIFLVCRRMSDETNADDEGRKPKGRPPHLIMQL
jgi:hypothetical protein